MFFIPISLLSNEDSIDLDLWSDVSWDTVTEITEVYGEVEQVTSVAGISIVTGKQN